MMADAPKNSAAIFNSIGNIMSIINPKTGQGGYGDHGVGSKFGCDKTRLSAMEISNALESEALLRTAIECIPEDICRAWRVFGNDSKKWVDIEESLNYKSVVERVLFWSEAFGGAFVLPRYKQTNVTRERLYKPFTKQPRGALLGFHPLMPHEIKPWSPSGANKISMIYDPMFCGDVPEYYVMERDNGLTDQDKTIIHYSWLIPVFGAFRSDASKNFNYHVGCEDFLGVSRVNIIANHLVQACSALQSTAHLLEKTNIDMLRVGGLVDEMGKCLSADDAAMVGAAKQRLAIAGMSANIRNFMVLDKDHEEFVRAGLGAGSGDSVEMTKVLMDAYVSATRIPRTRLLGEQSKGLGNGGDVDLNHYYDRVGAIRERRLTPVLNRMDQIAGVDRGAALKTWEYGTLYEPTDKERAEIQEINSRRDANYASMDISYIRSAIVENLVQSGVYQFSPKQINEIKETDEAIDPLEAQDLANDLN